MSDEIPGPEGPKPGNDTEFDELAHRAGAALRRPAPEDGVRAVTRRHRRQQALKATVVGGVAVAALVGTLAVAANRNDPDSLAPVDSPPAPPATLTATTTPPPVTATVGPEATDASTGETSPSTPAPPSDLPTTSAPPESDPSSWPTSTSTRYSFFVGHPPDWTEVPSSRDWSWETDIGDPSSAAHDDFLSPDDAIRVSVWDAPFDASSPPINSDISDLSDDDIVAWVEDYCERSGNSPCDGIADRAVELCLEKMDCHPGLLVPFENDVQAFLSGGVVSAQAMTIVAVWASESAPSVAPYGGAQQLLESFLVTMQVWPSSTPRDERKCVGISESSSIPGGCIAP